ncbi:hypothetical protein [Flavobacterium sp.]|uniref:hypothetical protein n=1 Tax=Flavobacterium sp. TaxID=239 RepID=UPI00374FEA1A
METSLKITHAIISNQIALNHNEAVKHTKHYKQGLKQKINLLLPELIKCETDYDMFFNKIESSTSEIYDEYENYIKAIASVPIWDCRNIRLIIEAYRIDPKSLEGIIKKILK